MKQKRLEGPKCNFPEIFMHANVRKKTEISATTFDQKQTSTKPNIIQLSFTDFDSKTQDTIPKHLPNQISCFYYRIKAEKTGMIAAKNERDNSKKKQTKCSKSFSFRQP